MQTFDVSANILNDRLTFSSIHTSRPKKMSTVQGPAVEEHVHVEPVPAVRSLTQCARTRLNDSLALVMLQLVSGVVLFGVLVHRQRLDAKLVCGAALLATPLAAMHVANLAPALPLLALLVLHDALVVVALAA
jgi:hypothetical protein